MTKRLWIVVLLGLAHVACRETGSQPVAPAKTPDRVIDESGIRVAYYDSQNPHTVDQLTTLSRGTVIGPTLDEFIEAGYAYRADDSFLLENDTADATPGQLAILALSRRTDPSRDHDVPAENDDVAYVFHWQSGGTTTVGAARLVMDPPTPGPEMVQMTDGVWLDFGEPGPKELDPGLNAFRWSWRQWGTCVSMASYGFLSSCASNCRWAGVGYFKCLGFCAAGAVGAAMFICALMQM